MDGWKGICFPWQLQTTVAISPSLKLITNFKLFKLEHSWEIVHCTTGKKYYGKMALQFPSLSALIPLMLLLSHISNPIRSFKPSSWSPILLHWALQNSLSICKANKNKILVSTFLGLNPYSIIYWDFILKYCIGMCLRLSSDNLCKIWYLVKDRSPIN